MILALAAICLALITRSMITRIYNVSCIRVDDTLKNATSVSVRAVSTHTTYPNTTKLIVAAAAFIAQRIPLIRSSMRPVAAHYPSAASVRASGLSTVRDFLARMPTAPVDDSGIVAHGDK